MITNYYPLNQLACPLSVYLQPVLLTIWDSGLLLWIAGYDMRSRRELA